MLKIEITRLKTSYSYKVNDSSASSYANNIAHNSQDIFTVKNDGKEIFVCRCQSVQNLDWGENKSNGPLPYGDTIAPGTFSLRCFAEPRNFHGSVHEIFNAHDMDGHKIDDKAMQLVDGKWSGRWLIHDKWSHKTGAETANAWSAGCIIMSCKDLQTLNLVLLKNGIKKGFVIKGEIKEAE